VDFHGPLALGIKSENPRAALPSFLKVTFNLSVPAQPIDLSITMTEVEAMLEPGGNRWRLYNFG
jgi:hypothetical protein